MEKALYCRCPDCNTPVSLYLSASYPAVDTRSKIEVPLVSIEDISSFAYTDVFCPGCQKQILIYFGSAVALKQAKEVKRREPVNYAKTRNNRRIREVGKRHRVDHFESAVHVDKNLDVSEQYEERKADGREYLSSITTPISGMSREDSVLVPTLCAAVVSTISQLIGWLLYIRYCWNDTKCSFSLEIPFWFVMSWLFLFIGLWFLFFHLSYKLHTQKSNYQLDKDPPKIKETHDVTIIHEATADKPAYASRHAYPLRDPNSNSDTEVTYDAMMEVAYLVMRRDKNLSERQMARAPKSPLTQDEYRIMKDYLISIGHVVPGGKGLGLELTEKGKADFDKLAEARMKIR